MPCPALAPAAMLVAGCAPHRKLAIHAGHAPANLDLPPWPEPVLR